ncbi:hypothetical protein LINPERPRIM_LOCUS29819 [Linum perenne]
MGNVRSFVGNCLGGLRGGSSLASWIVAGSIAYYLWVKPSQDLRRQQQVIFLLFLLIHHGCLFTYSQNFLLAGTDCRRQIQRAIIIILQVFSNLIVPSFCVLFSSCESFASY